MIRRALALLLLSFLIGPAVAQRESGEPVDLALVLAVDASGSVDRVRFELQKQGYVAAFRHPRVIGAIQSGPTQAIAVIMMQWTGPALQVTAVPWTKVSDAASANAFADKIAAAVLRQNLPQRLFPRLAIGLCRRPGRAYARNGQEPRRPVRQHVAESLNHDIGQQGADLIGNGNVHLNKNLVVHGQHWQHTTRPVAIALKQEPHCPVHDVRRATLHRIVHRSSVCRGIGIGIVEIIDPAPRRTHTLLRDVEARQ